MRFASRLIIYLTLTDRTSEGACGGRCRHLCKLHHNRGQSRRRAFRMYLSACDQGAGTLAHQLALPVGSTHPPATLDHEEELIEAGLVSSNLPAGIEVDAIHM